MLAGACECHCSSAVVDELYCHSRCCCSFASVGFSPGVGFGLVVADCWVLMAAGSLIDVECGDDSVPPLYCRRIFVPLQGGCGCLGPTIY